MSAADDRFDDDEDRYITGVRSGSFTISGTWNPSATAAAWPDWLMDHVARGREVVHVMGQRRLFGIDWWAERMRFTARLTKSSFDTDADGWTGVSLDMVPVSPVIYERAEWWRRWGYAIVSRLPEWSRPSEEDAE